MPSGFAEADPFQVSGREMLQGGASRRLPGHFIRAHFVDIAIVVLLVLLGAAQGWLRLTFLQSDAISYLDISHAIFRGDWKMVFNPFWGLGYPFLLAVVRLPFPATPQGEWISIHLTNLLIFLGAWAAFLYLLRSFPLGHEDDSALDLGRRRAFLKAAALCVFIAIEMGMDGVHAVEPDLLVVCYFFLAVAAMVRLVRLGRSHRAGIAVLLGCVLGLGYWVKAIALPLSIIVLAAGWAVLHWRKRSGRRSLALALAIFVLIVIPYVAGISWSYGRFTLGESGALNYGFHVNMLPHWTNWQGGPLPEYGTPIHPTRQVMSHPDVFVFGEPYHNTYPPFGNIAYWYKGHRRFFNAKLQAIAIARDGRSFVEILFKQPILYAGIAAFFLLWAAVDKEDRREWLRRMLRLWPLWAPGVAGIALYLLVHVEARYLSSFFAILYITPFLALALQRKLPPRKALGSALAILAIGAAANLLVMNRAVFHNIAHRSYYTNSPQWMLARGLRKDGLVRGDKIAAVGGPNAFCEWAYMDGLRIVAEMGGRPYDQRHPWENDPQAVSSRIRKFWEDPSVREEVMGHFRDAGAAAVIAPSKPAGLMAPGWIRPPGADVWVYRFPESMKMPPADSVGE